MWLYKDGSQVSEGTAYLGNSIMYHVSIGDMLYNEQFDKGTYMLRIINWAFNKNPEVEYIVQISQESSDQKIKVDGKLGKEVIQEEIKKEGKVEKKEEEIKPDSPFPNTKEEKERLKHDLEGEDTTQARSLFGVSIVALVCLFASILN